MAALFDTFPYLAGDFLIIRKMTYDDLEALREITDNDNIYRFIPPFLYKKSHGNLLAAIRNLGGRDFEKKKIIGAGIYLQTEPQKLIGLVEIFNYKPKSHTVTIGYKINEAFWHQGIATETIRLLKEYLCTETDICTVTAFVMPENTYSEKALLKNGFHMLPNSVIGKNWGGKAETVLHKFVYTSAPSKQP